MFYLSWLRAIVALLCLTGVGSLFGQSGAAALPLSSAQTLGEQLFVDSASTGMVLVVVRDRQTVIDTFGETSPHSHQVPRADSFVRLCSLTKIFATDLLLKMVQAHRVRLDTPLATLLPIHVPEPRPSRPMTLGDLATHTAGLPREIGAAPKGTPHFTYPNREERWHWLEEARLRTTPGVAALYSNVGFDLLGDGLERAAEMPYPQLLAKQTTQPLGMSETGFTPTAEQCGRLLVSAHEQGPCTSTTNSAGSSGLYSTANDMARFLEYLLGTGGSADRNQALPRQNSAAQAVYVEPAHLRRVDGLDHAGEATGIGLGWVHTPGSEGAEIVEKTGGGAGFSTYIAMLPSRHIGLFLAATDGTGQARVNLFRGANNLLLQLASLSPLPLPPPAVKVEARPRTRRKRRR